MQLAFLYPAVFILLLEIEEEDLGLKVLFVSIGSLSVCLAFGVSFLVFFITLIPSEKYTVQFLYGIPSDFGGFAGRCNILQIIKFVATIDGLGLVIYLRQFALGSDGNLSIALLVATQILLEVIEKIGVVGQHCCLPWFAVVEGVIEGVFHSQRKFQQ